jgi:hypothetical protein
MVWEMGKGITQWELEVSRIGKRKQEPTQSEVFPLPMNKAG